MDDLKTIVELSREFGTTTYVKGGGGNTSVKDETTLWVKPSGTTLGSLTEETFVTLNRAKVNELFEVETPVESAAREELVKNLMAEAVENEAGRIGLEAYYTGRQRLEDNPYRVMGDSYVIVGLLVERRVGRLRLFVNGENLTNVRQTRWDPLLRPARALDGRWTVDAWAPVDGRVINGGVRVQF